MQANRVIGKYRIKMWLAVAVFAIIVASYAVGQFSGGM